MMDDKKLEKIEKGLDCCTQYVVDCKHCPYHGIKSAECIAKLCADARKVIDDLRAEKRKIKEVVKDEM